MMRILQVCIFLLLSQVTIGIIDPEKDDTLKDRSYIVGLEMDDFPTRSATFVSANIFFTCTPKNSSDSQVDISRYRFYSNYWKGEKLYETTDPIQSAVKKYLFVGKLPSNIVFRTDLIRPLSMFMPEGHYTSVDYNYKFTYFIVSSNGSYTTPDFAFLVARTKKLFYLLGVKGKPSTTSLGSPVLARDSSNKIGLVGIIVTLTYDGIFGMQEIERFDHSRVNKLATDHIEMAAVDGKLNRRKECIPKSSYMVPISFDDDHENAFLSTFVTLNVALTYYNSIKLEVSKVDFHFKVLKRKSKTVYLNQTGVYFKKGLLVLVLSKKYTAGLNFVPVVKAYRKPQYHQNYTFYCFAARKTVNNITYMIGDSIDNGWTYDKETLRADYMPTKQTEIGSAYVYKDANDDKPMLVGIIKSVDPDGRFRVLDLSTNHAWIGFIILAASKNREALKQYSDTLDNLLSDDYQPSQDDDQKLDALIKFFGKLTENIYLDLNRVNKVLSLMPQLLKQRIADKDNKNIALMQTLYAHVELLREYFTI